MPTTYNSAIHELQYDFTYNNEETNTLHAEVNNKVTIDINDLRRISLWKLDRVLSVSDETIRALQAIAGNPAILIDDVVVKTAIENLVDSNGVGFPMASAFLKFINPSVFPIIDVRAYRALTGIKLYYSSYSYAIYILYAHAVMDIAAQTGRPLREIDEQLYCFDIEHNGKI